MDDIVFEYGSVGDKFYLILRGSVGVMVPSKVPKTDDNTSVQSKSRQKFMSVVVNEPPGR